MTRIVMLDRNALSREIEFKAFEHEVDWTQYAATEAPDIALRLADAEIAALSKVPINEQILAQCPKLKHIAVFASGYNVVDIEACRQHGVSVSNIPNYAATTVAEHVINVALSLRRELVQYRQQVINGKWQKSPGFCLFDKPVHEVSGATIGIVGLGDIGLKTAQLAKAIGMQVVYSARRDTPCEYGEQISFDEIIERADIISLHCSLNTSTVDLIAKPQLARMQKHCILINTARGGIVNELDLVAAIEQGEIGGAAFDVLVEEPPKDHSPLLGIAERSNVIITPHMSWTGMQAMQNLADILIDNIQGFINGHPQNIVS